MSLNFLLFSMHEEYDLKKTLKFLIVEDELLIAMSVKLELIEAGYEFCGHEIKGESAISSAREKKPDIIIMDIRLAGELDGIDTAKAIRSFSDCPIIFTTGYDSPGIREKIEKIEKSLYLEKPVTAGRLSPLINDCF